MTEEKKTCQLQDGNIAEVSVVSLKRVSEGIREHMTKENRQQNRGKQES